MKRFTLAAGTGSLLFVVALQVLNLQAQKPVESPSPVLQLPNATAPITQPVPDKDFKQPVDELTLQHGKGQTVHGQEPAADLARYPIWILIKPEGIQFLQTQDEIAANQNAIPPNAFLLGCVTVNFTGASVEQTPDFQLKCEDFLLMGRYGTKQNLDVKGASLTYSTKSKQIQLKGTEELPLEAHSVDEASETRMQADEIFLQLESGPRTVTRYVPTSVLKSGHQMTEYVPVTQQIGEGSSFHLSARNISNLEVIAIPARGGDAPVWNPDASAKEKLPVYYGPTPDPISTPPFDESFQPSRKRNKLPAN